MGRRGKYSMWLMPNSLANFDHRTHFDKYMNLLTAKIVSTEFYNSTAMRKKSLILLLMFSIALGTPMLTSCGSMRSYWGIEGHHDFNDPHYGKKKHKKHKKPKKHHKHHHHHHHDDDDDDD